MNPYYTRKLQSALIDIGKEVEANKEKPIPTMDELKDLFYKLASSPLIQQRKAANELMCGLLRWGMEKL